MKYAILADVHGNAPALRLVMEDALRQGAQAFLMLGDYCVSAPWPGEVVELLRQAPGAVGVRGNEESYLHIKDGTDGQFEVSRWCRRALEARQIAWLDALPETAVLSCEGVDIHMAHSSAMWFGDAEHGSFSTRMLPARYPHNIPHAQFLSDVRTTLAGDAQLQRRLREAPQGVYLFGHTHCQWHACLDGRMLINPGSCGLPLDCAQAFGAPYTLLTVQDGRMTVEERRVAYDAQALIAQVRATPQYEQARVWSEVIFAQWSSGREQMSFFLAHVQAYAQAIGDERRPFAKETWEAAYETWRAQL